MPRSEALSHSPSRRHVISGGTRSRSQAPIRLKDSQWQRLGVNQSLIHSLLLRGFKSPTPIQKSTLPLTLASPPRDVLGMARTGSGKTLAYLIPLLQRLSSSAVPVPSIKALILCPSRELAVQILKAGKDLARGLRKEPLKNEQPLRWAIIMGGESLDDHFEVLSGKPDVVVATPGRMLHLIVEMSLDLRTLEMVITTKPIGELFEMGFESQLREILHRLPSTRQSLLFSATLPTKVAEFAKAGLVNPSMIRLDAEQTISADLRLHFAYVKPADKDAAVLALLGVLLGKSGPSSPEGSSQIIIFVATKHHVEYLVCLLRAAGYESAYIYGSLDQVARKTQIDSFRAGRQQILVVTDVAARGLDIPMIGNVINYDFPTGVRGFVHRVGRTARAGRRGMAWSLVTTGDIAHLFDLDEALSVKIFDASPPLIGRLPQQVLETHRERIAVGLAESDRSLAALRMVKDRGQAMFERSKSRASADAHRMSKLWIRSSHDGSDLAVLPVFVTSHPAVANERCDDLLRAIETYRPRTSVGKSSSRVSSKAVVAVSKLERATVVSEYRQGSADFVPLGALSRSSTNERVFLTVPSSRSSYRNSEFFLPHAREDAQHEKTYSINGADCFSSQLRSATFNMSADEAQLRWDRRKKKFVQESSIDSTNQRMVRSESGALLPASFSSGRFRDWSTRRRVTSAGRGRQHSGSYPS
uniref:RNA helicase n=1 Tax=Tremella mesenterica TaxID=5217 RepID=E2I8I3_TREME|nr:CNB00610 [Tremella mesenterica]